MKPMLLVMGLLTAMCACNFAFAQDVASPATATLAQPVATIQVPVQVTVDNGQWLNNVITAVGGMKGAATIAIILALVQLGIAFFNSTTWGGVLSGDIKFWAIHILSILAQVLGLVASGMPWLSAIATGAVVSAAMDFIFQAISRLKGTAGGSGT